LAVGYGDQAAVTITAAFVLSLLATSALIRLWAALSDAHHDRRTVAMSEGEVSVSIGGIIAPLLVGGLAATVVSWRFAFAIGAAIVAVAVLAFRAVRVPASIQRASVDTAGGRRLRLSATLVVVFAIVALEWALSFWLASYLNDNVGLRRNLAVAMVSGLYVANLAGRLLASRLARRIATRRLLFAAMGVGLLGMPILLSATNAAVAALGIGVAGAGIGAMFPLTSSLHVAGSSRTSDSALGQVLAIAAIGQIVGPLSVAAIAQGAGLRIGLLMLPALAVLAVCALARHKPLEPLTR
jgi:fucose permease